MRRWHAALALGLAFPATAQEPAMPKDIIVIAHRGASGERPEHTLAAYDRAIEQGADYVEPDLVVTKDGVLVARHENEIGGTTDVADHPEFAERRATKMIDGQAITGWFVEDFTLAELRTLRARERIPQLRPANARFDGLFPIPTLAEIIQLVRAREAETGRRIGIGPELKHPSFLAEQGHDTVALLVEQLHAAAYRSADEPVFIQCFEVAPLVRLNGLTELRLVQLVSAQGGPADQPDTTYTAMLAPAGLPRIAEHADAIGAELALLLHPNGSPTDLIERAHEAGLAVHGWTLRRENAFLPAPLHSSDAAAAPGDYTAMWRMLQAAGVDGIFTDNPAQGVAARAQLRK
jgi:glycerophosphoryl diester phosphodiesterase